MKNVRLTYRISMKGKLTPWALAGIGLSQDSEETIWILGQVKVGVTTEDEHPKLKDFKTCLNGEGV